MQIKEVEKLKSWLFKKLEPLCDADPAALAKYVVALLRKEKPKSALRELCVDQLEVFLAKETTSFVEKLFRCLESESYLKGEDPPPKTPPPSPPAAIQTVSTPTQNKQLEDKEVDDDDRDFRRSRRNDSDSSVSQTTRKVVMTSTPSGGGGGGSGSGVGIGRKRKHEGVQDVTASTSSGCLPKRRTVIDLKRGSADSNLTTVPASASDGVSSSTSSVSSAGAGARRPVRERLGPKQEERSESSRSRRYRRGRSSSSSDSSSDSRSGDEGERSSRKRRRDSGSGKPGGEGRKRQRCKDYDEKGFCIMGENCRYDHGTDPLVIGGEINRYTPLPRLGMPPGMPIPPMTKPYTSTDGYNPEDPGLSMSTAPKGFIPPPLIPPPLPLRGPFPPPLPHMTGITIPPPPSLPLPHMFNTPAAPSLRYPHPRPRPPPPSGHMPMRPSDTLIIRKVPRELNTITKLSSHFEKFGTIVNLTVHYEGDPEGALVQFSNHFEARKAHNCTEAVLNNRFIRVYYLRKDLLLPQKPLMEHTLESPASVAISTIRGMPPPPTITSAVSSSEVSPPAHPTPDSSVSITTADDSTATNVTLEQENEVEKVKKSPITPSPIGVRPSHPPSSHPHTNPQQRRSTEVAKKNLELQKKSHELLQKQIQQQKLLIVKLEKSGKHLSAGEKSTIVESLKTLSGSISKLKEAATRTTVATKQEAKKEHLQQKHTTTKQQPQSDLKEKADALRKKELMEAVKEWRQGIDIEAHVLGLISSPSQPLPTPCQGKTGGKDLRSKLDVKPRQLLVINVDNRDLLTSYFESFGGLEMVELDPNNSKNLIFTFRNSSTANKVVKKGSTLNGKPIIMKWYTPKPLQVEKSPTLPTLTPPAIPLITLPHHHNSTSSASVQQVAQPVVRQVSNDEAPLPTTPTLMKPDPSDLHLVEDSEDEDDESEGRSWRR